MQGESGLCAIANALTDNPITARESDFRLIENGRNRRSRNEGTIVPSFRPLFGFRRVLRNLFALASWRLLPL